MRKPTSGPEFAMVESFVEILEDKFPPPSARFETLLFIEPHLDSGYPDMVMALFDTSSLNTWTDLRTALGDREYKILGFICQHRGVTSKHIAAALGFPSKAVDLSLELLRSCGLLAYQNALWRAIPRTRFFGLKQLISFEAKVSDYAGACRQAIINRRFASQSYILIDSKRPSASLVARCNRFRLGIICDSGQALGLRAPKVAVPLNHVSLRFNEWAAAEISEGRR